MDLNSIEERLGLIEFKQELLFNNSDVDRMLFEYDITRGEYKYIMDLMDRYRERIESGNLPRPSHSEFESDIYKKIKKVDGDYHFCEYITKAFMDAERWESVFPALYGMLPKYKHLMKERNHE